MATTKRDDGSASESANSGDAKSRSAIDLQERAGAQELMTEEALRERQEAISLKRRQAGPELVAPTELGEEALGGAPDGAEDVPPTELEEPED